VVTIELIAATLSFVALVVAWMLLPSSPQIAVAKNGRTPLPAPVLREAS
jgi:hypothetical protein